MSKVLFFAVLIFFAAQVARAEEVYLKNGDRITGEIIKDEKDFVVIKSDVVGEVNIGRDSIERISPQKEQLSIAIEEGPDIIWDKSVTIGYDRSGGNTDSSELNIGFIINRNRVHVDEVTIKGESHYASSDRKMDAQKWASSLRCAYSFGPESKWYNFYMLGADHDRFTNVDYRLLPTLGLGRWFYDRDSLKLLAEIAFGYEYTDYRDQTGDSEEVVLAPRGFFERLIFGDTRIREDIFFYPALDDFSDFRLHSETVLINPINNNVSLDISLIEEYDAEPEGDTKKNDLRLITSLTYSF